MAAPASRPDSMVAPQPPALSVVLPVYNAMRTSDAYETVPAPGSRGWLKLICAWDGGDVDAWSFSSRSGAAGCVEVVDGARDADVLKTERQQDAPPVAPIPRRASPRPRGCDHPR